MKMEEVLKLPYKEMMQQVLDGCPSGNWYKMANWLKNTYTQRDLIEIAKILYTKLCDLSDIDNDSQEADDLRDQLDPFWLACDRTLLEDKIDEVLTSRGELS